MLLWQHTIHYNIKWAVIHVKIYACWRKPLLWGFLLNKNMGRLCIWRGAMLLPHNPPVRCSVCWHELVSWFTPQYQHLCSPGKVLPQHHEKHSTYTYNCFLKSYPSFYIIIKSDCTKFHDCGKLCKPNRLPTGSRRSYLEEIRAESKKKHLPVMPIYGGDWVTFCSSPEFQTFTWPRYDILPTFSQKLYHTLSHESALPLSVLFIIFLVTSALV